MALGDTVCFHATIGGDATSCGHVVTAIELRGGTWVAWITGVRGCVAVEALSGQEVPIA